MAFLSILPSYVVWHYGEALRDGVRVWTNFLWFLSNFFSLFLLFKTLFAPWKRIQESRGRLSMENIAEVVMANTVMRAVGALMRSVIIIIGTLCVLAVFWFGVILFIVWLALPVLAVVSFTFGISTLFS